MTENATRRGFLKGGLVAGAASFFDFGALSKFGGKRPPLEIVSEKRVPIPQFQRDDLELAQAELRRRGFSVPLRAATRYKVRTPEGRKTMTHFESHALEQGNQRASLVSVASQPLTTVAASVTTWDGASLVGMEIFEVQGGALRSILAATLHDGKVTDLQGPGLTEEETSGFVATVEALQEQYFELQEAGEVSCCSCISTWAAFQYLVCTTISIVVCMAFPWPFSLLCGLIFSYACFLVSPSCEDKCQLCRAECTGPLACYGCC